VSGPSAAQSVIEPIGYAVNFALRASRPGFGYQAIPAGIAGTMNVEKRDAIAFAETIAFNVKQIAADLL
jgi:hypothetical protein